jgi:hypothetical protein
MATRRRPAPLPATAPCARPRAVVCRRLRSEGSQPGAQRHTIELFAMRLRLAWWALLLAPSCWVVAADVVLIKVPPPPPRSLPHVLEGGEGVALLVCEEPVPRSATFAHASCMPWSGATLARANGRSWGRWASRTPLLGCGGDGADGVSRGVPNRAARWSTPTASSSPTCWCAMAS